ncbi:MAG: hypothetical protein LBF25_01935 [Puniceicoccales bacterium]|jgi:hypothetical protein|nr:hypothetical protein [Puniceicoccales bacterium]
MDENERKAERKRVSDLFKKSLRRRYPELTEGIGSFKELWILEDNLTGKRRKLRTAYEVLKFLRLAPLTPKLGDGGLDDKKVREKEKFQSKIRVFNQEIRSAYNIMSVGNVRNIPSVQEQYRGVWDIGNIVGNMEQKLVEARNYAEEARKSAVDFIVRTICQFATSEVDFPDNFVRKWIRDTFLRPENVDMGREIIRQLETREASIAEEKREKYENMRLIAKEEYERIVHMPKQPLRTSQKRKSLWVRDDDSSESTKSKPKSTKPRGRVG